MLKPKERYTDRLLSVLDYNKEELVEYLSHSTKKIDIIIDNIKNNHYVPYGHHKSFHYMKLVHRMRGGIPELAVK